MANDVRVLFADPRCRLVGSDSGYWIISGDRPDAIERVLTSASSPRHAWNDLDGVVEDAVVVHISTRLDGAHAIDAFRSVTATRELYTLRGSDGDVVVTDHFRNALAHLDVSDRTVTTAAIADHLLFRAPIEPETYVSRVDALGQGTWLQWSLRDDDQTRTQVSRLSGSSGDDASEALAPDDAPAVIDRTLSSLLEDVCGNDTVATMLSGGVDSTLLHTYREDEPSLVIQLDSPEVAFECEYADRAASLLDAMPRYVDIDESEYLSHLETSIDRLGFPSHYVQTALTDAAFARDSDSTDAYLNGEGADALFGLPGAKGLRIATWFDSLLAYVPDRTSTVVPETLSVKFDSLLRIATQMRRHPADPDSFAVQLPFFTDGDVVATALGTETVDRRVQAQYDYLTQRVDLAANDVFSKHAAYGHLYSFFRHNTCGQWRQLAYSHDKTIVYPFRCERLARRGLAVPTHRRYIQGLRDVGTLGPRYLEPKYLLKSLLAERCADYPVKQQKGSGALPIERYFESGPLATVFDRYDPPAFIPDSMYADHVESYGPVTWNLITYAIWRDRVLSNPDIEPVEGSREWIQSISEKSYNSHGSVYKID